MVAQNSHPPQPGHDDHDHPDDHVIMTVLMIVIKKNMMIMMMNMMIWETSHTVMTTEINSDIGVINHDDECDA